MSEAISQEAKIAQATFDIENNVQNLDDSSDLYDSIYAYDAEEQEAIREAAPWKYRVMTIEISHAFSVH